jgi:hypothetical protein
MDGLQEVRTVLEMDFGRPICDVNYFPGLGGRLREESIFICGHYSSLSDADTRDRDLQSRL